MLGTVLGQRFYNIWYVGEVTEEGIDRVIEFLRSLQFKAESGVKIRFYLENVAGLRYLHHVRRVLISNTSLSIVVEEKLLSELENDAQSMDGEIVLIANKYDLDIPNSEKIKIVKV